MATRAHEGTSYDIRKVHSGNCDKCGGSICVGWAVFESGQHKREASFCYACTSNKWNKAFALFKELKAVMQNGEVI